MFLNKIESLEERYTNLEGKVKCTESLRNLQKDQQKIEDNLVESQYNELK